MALTEEEVAIIEKKLETANFEQLLKLGGKAWDLATHYKNKGD